MSQPVKFTAVGRPRGFSVMAFLGLAAVVPLLLTWDQGGIADGRTPWLALAARLAIVAYASGQLAALLTRAEGRWFATIFWSFVYVWMGLAGLVQVLAGRNPFGFVVSPVADLTSSLVVLVGLGAAHLAYRSVRDEDGHSPSVRYVSPRAVMTLACVATVTTPLLLLQQSGVGTYLQSREAVNESLASAGLVSGQSLALGGIVRSLTLVPPFVALLGIVAAFRYYPPLRKRPVWWVAAVVVVALNVLVNNPVGTSRFWFGTVLLGLMFSLPVMQRPNVYKLFLVSLLVALTVVFPYADYFRLDAGSTQERRPVSQFMVSKLDYDAVAQVTYAEQLYDRNGPDFGYQILGAAGFAIPRSAWENKPRPTGEVLADQSGFHFTNLSAPLWAEAYIALGFLGVLLVFALFGGLIGRGDRAILRASRAREFLLAGILLPPLAAYSMIVLRGSLLAVIGQGVILAAILSLLGQRKRPTLRAAPGTIASDRLNRWECERLELEATNVATPAQGRAAATPPDARASES